MSKKYTLVLVLALFLALTTAAVQANVQPASAQSLSTIEQFPGGDILVEQKLRPGVNYSRYIVSYHSDHLKIYALMTVPSGKMPPSGWPVIVFNHGHIIPNQYTTTGNYQAYVDAFARHGYIVFKSDYRGNGQSEGIPAGKSTQSRSVYVTDVLNAVKLLKLNPYVDPHRIGMWGHSMGGYVTVAAMLVSNDIKAGVVWAGTLSAFKDSSLLKNLSAPLQLAHATGDQTVPYSTSVAFVKLMEKAGLNVSFYTYRGDNHNLSENAAAALTRALNFFDKYVKNAPGS